MRRGLSRFAGKFALSAWFLVMLGGSAIMLGRHVIALPEPSPGDRALAGAVSRLREPNDATNALVVHVLYAKCECSKRIAQHLATSKRPERVTEVVLLAGDETSESYFETLLVNQFRIVHVRAGELHTTYHIDAAPLLVVVGKDETIKYAGGYTTSKQSLDVHDLDIIQQTTSRESSPTPSLPIFGCAVSEQLRRQLDPTNIL